MALGSTMQESIFDSVKDYLGPSDEDTHFDGQILEQINAAFYILHQHGVGPEEGFYVEDASTTWADFTLPAAIMLQGVKPLIQKRVKRAIDPPTSSFVLESLNKQIAELEYRLYLDASIPGATT